MHREDTLTMELRAEEISRIIKKQIQDFSEKTAVAETGSVLAVGDGVARIYGLEKAQACLLYTSPSPRD